MKGVTLLLCTALAGLPPPILWPTQTLEGILSSRGGSVAVTPVTVVACLTPPGAAALATLGVLAAPTPGKSVAACLPHVRAVCRRWWRRCRRDGSGWAVSARN